nr:hypothetical protein [uncultured Tyzzerella sp.]
MEVWHSISGTTKIEIKGEDFKQMFKDKVDIEDINSIDNWIRKNIAVDMNIDIFNTDIDETEIEDYLLSEDEESILVELQKELEVLEKDLPMKNQLDLFGGVVGV